MDRREFLKAAAAVAAVTATPKVFTDWSEHVVATPVSELANLVVAFIDEHRNVLACGTSQCSTPASNGFIPLDRTDFDVVRGGIAERMVVSGPNGFEVECSVGESGCDINLSSSVMSLGDRVQLFGVSIGVVW